MARDMAGRVLLDAVSDERAASVPLRLIPSYGPPEKQGPGDRGPVPGADMPPP